MRMVIILLELFLRQPNDVDMLRELNLLIILEMWYDYTRW